MAETPQSLPEVVYEELVPILEGSADSREAQLRGLLQRYPEHCAAIVSWLHRLGEPVPATALPPRSPEFPRPLGTYLLLKKLGSGGFGTVYLGRCAGDRERLVAIKVINPGMGSPEFARRFASEREALQRMDHPGIARVLDVGEANDRSPYLVMEYIDGPTLVHHCRQGHLPLRARIELFLQVLSAVQHAHLKFIVHRDLSANNVLVANANGQAQIKIIDFGIAKSLADPLLLGPGLTTRGTLLGTPEYMSPEQAAGRVHDIDLRTDIYSLGVQLYELLCDQLPISGAKIKENGHAGMAQIIAECAVPPPSTLMRGKRGRLLRGDLDAIVGKALGKEPNERYQTVEALADDLTRHFQNLPIEAAPPSWLTRAQKFVRRNRGLSAAVAIAALSLLLGTLALAWSLRTAHAALQQVEEQKAEVAKKADAGFRLLANGERLRKALDAANLLPPPWPEHIAAYRNWEQQHAAPLAAELRKTIESLQIVQARRQTNAPALVDPVDAHLEKELTRLQAQLEQFQSGEAQRIARLRARQEAITQSTAQHAGAWRQMVQQVKLSDGQASARAYAGLTLQPLPGLVPLGVDPITKFAEFLDFASHPPDAPLPQREAGGLPTQCDCGIVFVLIPPGTMRLGAQRGEPGLPQSDPMAAENEQGGETLRLEAFLLAKTELTDAQWRRLRGASAEPATATLPARSVSWHEATDVLRRFSMHLPSEAQWEYACRAGTQSPWSFGHDAALCSGNVALGPAPEPVARLAPNPFGLFDMHGNVAEWCRDDLQPYGSGDLRRGDGFRTAKPTSEMRTLRGGAVGEGSAAWRCTARAGLPPGEISALVGLRAARSLRD